MLRQSELFKTVLSTAEPTRISLQASTAASSVPQPARFAPIGLLNVPSGTPPRPSGRKPPISQHLADLVTNLGEICGFILLGFSFLVLAFCL